MLFNSYGFILLFLPLAVAGYFLFGHPVSAKGLSAESRYDKVGMVYLAVLSLLFCGYQGWMHPAILILSILCNYGITALMKKRKQQDAKRRLLAAGIVFDIGVLLLFKFLNLLHGIGMPLGVSFYTFGQIAYLVDFYRGEGRDYHLLEYVSATAFFPKLIQGPITYYKELIPEFRDRESRKPNYVHLCKGLYAFALGLAKKVLLADTLAKLVNIGYGNIEELGCLDVILVMVCYSLQIYFDFSGYCDMAMGIGSMLNLELPLNFNSPYKATSISDFWDRWHITLTRFLTKYLYFPLGGSRKGQARTILNILIVFLVSGFWHGANWTFLLWGLLNGLLMVFERMAKVEEWKLPKLLKQTVAFILTTFAWSIFRADSISQVIRLWGRLSIWKRCGLYAPITECFHGLPEMSILTRLGISRIPYYDAGFFVILFVAVLVAACFVMKNTQEKVGEMKLTARKLLVTAGLLFWSILSLSEISAFIYFNF